MHLSGLVSNQALSLGLFALSALEPASALPGADRGDVSLLSSRGLFSKPNINWSTAELEKCDEKQQAFITEEWATAIEVANMLSKDFKKSKVPYHEKLFAEELLSDYDNKVKNTYKQISELLQGTATDYKFTVSCDVNGNRCKPGHVAFVNEDPSTRKSAKVTFCQEAFYPTNPERFVDTTKNRLTKCKEQKEKDKKIDEHGQKSAIKRAISSTDSNSKKGGTSSTDGNPKKGGTSSTDSNPKKGGTSSTDSNPKKGGTSSTNSNPKKGGTDSSRQPPEGANPASTDAARGDNIVNLHRSLAMMIIHECCHTTYAMKGIVDKPAEDYAYGYKGSIKLRKGKFNREIEGKGMRKLTSNKPLCGLEPNNKSGKDGICDAKYSFQNPDSWGLVATGVWFEEKCGGPLYLPEVP